MQIGQLDRAVTVSMKLTQKYSKCEPYLGTIKQRSVVPNDVVVEVYNRAQMIKRKLVTLVGRQSGGLQPSPTSGIVNLGRVNIVVATDSFLDALAPERLKRKNRFCNGIFFNTPIIFPRTALEIHC